LKYLKPEFFDERILKQSTDRAAEDIVRDYEVEVPKGIKVVSLNILKVGKYNFQIIPSPGHTSDSVLLFDPRNKILVSGDTLYDGTPYANFPDSNKKEFLVSLEAIRSLDYQLVLPGHNKMLNKKLAQSVIENWEDLLR
jgi:glyoxylase-like metal-dependent hydrolase (beta-lactamase superfamily II)